jgi:hypothetical protein
MRFKTIGKTFKIPGTAPGQNRPEARAHGARRHTTRGQPKHRLGHGLAAQPNGATGLRGLLRRRAPHGHHPQTVRGTAQWRARRRLSGGSMVARCCRRSQVGQREGAGQGGEGRGAPERWVDGEVVQMASGGGICRWGGGSGGWRRRVWGPVAPERQGGEEITRNCRD